MKRVNAIGYTRVSTEEQAKEGISLDVQEDKIRQYAKLNNLKLVDIIIDEGKSGKDLNREGIQKVISLCKKKTIDHLIVYKVDRLTRMVIDLLNLVKDVFEFNGVQFHSITEKIDSSSAMGKAFLTIIGVMAQMERDLISERTKTALQFKIDRGEYVGSPSLGYEASTGGNKFLDINEREKDTVKRIFYLKRYKHLSLGKIAKELNESGVETKRGGKWHSGTIKLILDRGESKFLTNESSKEENKELSLV
jgi:site-specific DNA recombinase